jgi:transcriptional regulator with XRE-family HTH domain
LFGCAIDASGQSRYRIAQESGIAESVLSRFYRGEMDLTAENIRRLTAYLGLEIVIRPKRRQRSK